MNLPALVRRACLAEATARKPGNVHPGASFGDLTYDHFVTAADIAAATLPRAGAIGVGPAALACVEATVAACGTNVNLGAALLLAPLCAAPLDVPLAEGIGPVSAGTTVADAEAAYAAIRLAKPGGLGDAAEQDVRDVPTLPLAAAMALAADRDAVAAEYAGGFRRVARLAAELGRFWPRGRGDWEDAVILAYLGELRTHPDSHVARRCGDEEADRVRRRVRTGWGRVKPPLVEQPWVRALDGFLRGDGHRRNPGATADLTAAALFWAARDGLIGLPNETTLAARAAANKAGRVH